MRMFGCRVIVMVGITVPNKLMAVLNMATTWGDRVKDTQALYLACLNNTRVTFDPVDLGILQVKKDTFKNAQADVDNKVVGAVEVRDAAWEDLYSYLMNEWKWKVQAFANANVAEAGAIIKSCNYGIKEDNPGNRSDFSVKATTTYGQLKFMVNGKNLYKTVQGTGSKAITVVTYEQSFDGLTWTTVPGSMGKKTKLFADGYIRGQVIYFRAKGYYSKNRESDYVYSGPIFL